MKTLSKVLLGVFVVAVSFAIGIGIGGGEITNPLWILFTSIGFIGSVLFHGYIHSKDMVD